MNTSAHDTEVVAMFGEQVVGESLVGSGAAAAPGLRRVPVSAMFHSIHVVHGPDGWPSSGLRPSRARKSTAKPPREDLGGGRRTGETPKKGFS